MKSNIYYHITEIRLRFIYSIFSFCVTFCVASIFSYEFLYIFTRFHENILIFTYISEAFYTHIKICFIISIVCVFPFLFYHIWCFLSPSYFHYEKIKYISFLKWGGVTFILNNLFFYFELIPFWDQFFSSYQVKSPFLTLHLEARIESYINFIVILYWISLVIWIFPFIFALVLWSRPLSIFFLIKNRSIFYVGGFLGAALISPPDIASQILCASGLIIYYELVLLFGLYLYKKHCHLNRIKTSLSNIKRDYQ